LKHVRHLKGAAVFCRPDGKRYKTWELRNPLRRTCERAGLRKVAWHVLRHTFCSHLAMRGAAPAAIQALAGHQSVTTTMRYMHLAPVVLRETVKLLEQPVAAPARRCRRTGAYEFTAP
jgi:site-specific recombinase XerD